MNENKIDDGQVTTSQIDSFNDTSANGRFSHMARGWRRKIKRLTGNTASRA
jgi:hypothetical protein